MPLQFQHILFPVDFSQPCVQVVPWVAEMVKRLGSRLTVLHVWEPPYSWSGEIDPRLLEGPSNYEQLESRAQTALEEFRMAHLVLGTAEMAVRKGDPARSITEYARTTDVDLIMMPTHGYGPFRAALLGSVTTKVIHDSDCAVWTSAHIEKLQNPAYPYRLIMCAVGDTDESMKTIRQAARLAEDLECSLTIVHAVPPDKSESELFSRVQSCEAFANVPMCVERGEIASIVPETAKRYGADLLVIGRGHAPDVLGSWRSHVHSIIRNSPCPVLTL